MKNRPPSDSPLPLAEFETLLATVRGCTLCKELPLGPKPIVQLDPRARILIASQAPGRRAHQQGVPFDDPSGERLRAWMGVDHATFYDPTKIAILPMGFCFPGSAKNGDMAPRLQCAETWRQPLLSALPQIELALVIGRYAQEWHFGGAGPLTERVRRWQDYLPTQLPLPHPSPRNRPWLKHNPWFENQVVPALRQHVADLLNDF